MNFLKKFFLFTILTPSFPLNRYPLIKVVDIILENEELRDTSKKYVQLFEYIRESMFTGFEFTR